MKRNLNALPLPSDLVIARHGRTWVNEATTNPDRSSAKLMRPIPLEDHKNTVDIDKTGERQARNLGKHLLPLFPGGFAICLRSDFKRVRRTLELAIPDMPEDRIVVSKALRERNRGDAADIPKWQLESQFPEHVPIKAESPINWKPPGNSQTLYEKASQIRRLLPLIGRRAANLPAAIFTSGEVEIASYIVPELGNMDDMALKRGFKEGWPALAVDNAQYVWYTRRSEPENPESPLSETFDHMISIRAAQETATSSGWVRIKR